MTSNSASDFPFKTGNDEGAGGISIRGDAGSPVALLELVVPEFPFDKLFTRVGGSLTTSIRLYWEDELWFELTGRAGVPVGVEEELVDVAFTDATTVFDILYCACGGRAVDTLPAYPDTDTGVEFADTTFAKTSLDPERTEATVARGVSCRDIPGATAVAVTAGVMTILL